MSLPLLVSGIRGQFTSTLVADAMPRLVYFHTQSLASIVRKVFFVIVLLHHSIPPTWRQQLFSTE